MLKGALEFPPAQPLSLLPEEEPLVAPSPFSSVALLPSSSLDSGAAVLSKD